MRRLSKCGCGSGKIEENCCGPIPSSKVRCIPIKSEQERQEYLRNIQISSEFSLKYTAICEYYGKDFIAYKLEKPKDTARNEFLRVIARYMANILDDDCPSSWKRCHPSFWEELITTIHPIHIQVSPQELEVEKFLFQLKQFGHWLDKKAKTSWANVIDEYIEKYRSELGLCESLLNKLFFIQFPNLYTSHLDPVKEFAKVKKINKHYQDLVHSVFEVKSVNENRIVLLELGLLQHYHVKGLPGEMITEGVLLEGAIGRKKGEATWKWCLSESVYPQNAKKYIMSSYQFGSE